MPMSRPSRSITSPFNAAARCLLLVVCGLLFFSAATAAAGEFIRDKKGRQIPVNHPFTRIISLYGAHTENLFALGLDKEIVGVSVNDTYPAQVAGKPRFSYHDDPEKFMAARPDLVLVRPMVDLGYPDFIGQLERFGITVVSLQPANVEEMLTYWQILGRLTGRVEQAEEMVETFRRKTRDIREKVAGISPRKRVYFESIHSRMKTFSTGSMALFALESAGGINVATDAAPSRNSNIANYGKERILSHGQSIDIFLAQRGIMNPVTREMILSEPGFQTLKAVKDGQVYLIDENIVSRPVPRLTIGMLTIGKILYPDVFIP